MSGRSFLAALGMSQDRGHQLRIEPAESFGDYLFLRALRNQVRHLMTNDTGHIGYFRQLKFYLRARYFPEKTPAVFIARHDRRPVGYLLVRRRDDRTVTVTEVVAPEFRNRGIGKALIAFAQARFPEIIAEIREDNTASIKLHESSDFELVMKDGPVLTYRCKSKPDTAELPPSSPKQAILVIHGMGEQKPMDTIKDFVRAVWQTNPDVHNHKVRFPEPHEIWSKPDVRTGSLELRRITTPPSKTTKSFKDGVRSDFYEFYWADLSGGSTWSEVKDWIAGLLLRNPFARVPSNVFLAWILLWFITLLVGVLTVATVLPLNASLGTIKLWELPGLRWLAGFQGWQLGLIAAVLAYAIHKFVVPYFGRVVRYTRAEPENIAARKHIRERGLELLRQLHAAEYERIIVVGHSLGSILAYDLVSYYWAQHPETHTVRNDSLAEFDEFDAFRKLENAAAALATAPAGDAKAVESFHKAQTNFCRLLRKRSAQQTRWLITDLVTLGSPLTHAEFLLANSADDLTERIDEREFPTCPPVRERLHPTLVGAAQAAGLLPVIDEQKQALPAEEQPTQQQKLASFAVDPKNPDTWRLHHAAPFAVVRWTNIHDPARLVFFGDIVSGALAPVFGRGVIDVDLRKLRGRQSKTFTHTKYWSNADAVVELRKALDLAGECREL